MAKFARMRLRSAMGMLGSMGLALVVFGAGCGFGGAPLAGGDGGSGTIDGGVDASADGSACTPRCIDSTQLDECGATPTTCPLGCVPASSDGGAPAHCAVLQPSNGASIQRLNQVTADLVIDQPTASLDTDTGEIYNGTTKVRTAGANVKDGIGYYVTSADVALVTVNSLTVAEDARLRIYGTRPIILLARGPVTIRGVIDVGGVCVPGSSGTCLLPAPGGGRGSAGQTKASGCGPGQDAAGDEILTTPEGGGGGGGLGTAGAKGGDGDGMRPGGAGGEIAACPGATLVPLEGGSGGGQGGGTTLMGGGMGGAGGGAIQITSLDRIAIVASSGKQAGIYAGGGGGKAGNLGMGGGGGGSGGAILLEAPVVVLDRATLAANGGGGGEGNGFADGEDARFGASPAEGGGMGPTAGGGGGAKGSLPEPGSGGGGGGTDGGGGGGGAVGLIRINGGVGYIHELNSPVLSPQPTYGQAMGE